MADPRAARLKVVPLFAHCDGKQIDFIATQVEEMDFAAGRVLCTEGSFGGDFFILESGSADVTRGGKQIASMKPGDFFGEIALVDGGKRTATVTTSSPPRPACDCSIAPAIPTTIAPSSPSPAMQPRSRARRSP